MTAHPFHPAREGLFSEWGDGIVFRRTILGWSWSGTRTSLCHQKTMNTDTCSITIVLGSWILCYVYRRQYFSTIWQSNVATENSHEDVKMWRIIKGWLLPCAMCCHLWWHRMDQFSRFFLYSAVYFFFSVYCRQPPQGSGRCHDNLLSTPYNMQFDVDDGSYPRTRTSRWITSKHVDFLRGDSWNVFCTWATESCNTHLRSFKII